MPVPVLQLRFVLGTLATHNTPHELRSRERAYKALTTTLPAERYDVGREHQVKEDQTMPQYSFFCSDCEKEFTRVLHIEELDKGVVDCPFCGSKHVTQLVVEFSPVTSKKS